MATGQYIAVLMDVSQTPHVLGFNYQGPFPNQAAAERWCARANAQELLFNGVYQQAWIPQICNVPEKLKKED